MSIQRRFKVLTLFQPCVPAGWLFENQFERNKRVSISIEKKELTHLRLASTKRDIGKQCRPISDAAERGV